MTLSIQKTKFFTTKNIIVIVVAILLVAGVAAGSVNLYRERKAQKAEQVRIDTAQASAEAISKAKYSAQVNRLVSICITAQERYDALTPKAKTLETRPDCTISQQ